VVSFTPRPLYPQGKSRPGRGGEEKNSQRMPGLEPPIIQLKMLGNTKINKTGLLQNSFLHKTSAQNIS
jgi:hypothetical protein